MFERERISLARLYERVEKSVIGVCERTLKGLTGTFYGSEKDKKSFWFSDIFIIENGAFTAIKRDAAFYTRM